VTPRITTLDVTPQLWLQVVPQLSAQVLSQLREPHVSMQLDEPQVSPHHCSPRLRASCPNMLFTLIPGIAAFRSGSSIAAAARSGLKAIGDARGHVGSRWMSRHSRRNVSARARNRQRVCIAARSARSNRRPRALSLPQNSKQLTAARELVDNSFDERSLQVDLVRLDRVVPVARSTDCQVTSGIGPWAT
jgi:hypothetical protein